MELILYGAISHFLRILHIDVEMSRFNSRERQTPIVHMSKPLNEVVIIKIFVDYYYILKNSSLFQIDAFHNKVSVIDIINFFNLQTEFPCSNDIVEQNKNTLLNPHHYTVFPLKSKHLFFFICMICVTSNMAGHTYSCLAYIDFK